MNATTFKTLNRNNTEKTFTGVNMCVSIDGSNNIITADGYELTIDVNGNNNTVIISAHVADVNIDLLSGKNNRIILCNSGYVSIWAGDEVVDTVVEVDDIDFLKLRVDIDYNAVIKTNRGLHIIVNDIITL